MDIRIAVIVALVITKGSTPFTDKFGKVGKSTEPATGQISDPNKPLYSNKDAAREANKEFVKDPAPVAAPDLATAALPAPTSLPTATPAVPPAAPPVKPEPVVAKLEAPRVTVPDPTNSPAKADAASADEKTVYYLQAGAFRETADAENTRAKLALLGFEAVISDRHSDSGVLHRVRLGPFLQVEAMNKVRSKLSDNGVDVAVVRINK